METVANEDHAETVEPAPWIPDPAGIYFSDRFNVSPQTLDAYGAFDISVVSDLPVFIDPFLLFNSDKEEYQALHEQILEYLRFLRDHAHEPLEPGREKTGTPSAKSARTDSDSPSAATMDTASAKKFAVALHAALGDVLDNFGNETHHQFEPRLEARAHPSWLWV